MKNSARRFFLPFLMLVVLILPLPLASCTAGKPYVLAIDPKSVTPTGLTLTVRRTIVPGDWTFGEDFTVEQKTDAGWEPVPVLDPDMNYAFISIGYELFPDLWKTMPVDWSWLYGELPPGQYRIGNTASAGKEGSRVTIRVEFEIKE